MVGGFQLCEFFCSAFCPLRHKPPPNPNELGLGLRKKDGRWHVRIGTTCVARAGWLAGLAGLIPTCLPTYLAS